MTDKKKAAPDWERIELDYRAGVKSQREIASEHGVTHVASPNSKAASAVKSRHYAMALLDVAELMASDKLPAGNEHCLVRQFMDDFSAGVYDDRLPLTANDTIQYEMSRQYGRADIVVFHVDGSASVIEVKDGRKGYTHVVAGIGQASLYAAQLVRIPGIVTSVRRCLLWSSTGSSHTDGVIEDACELAGVIALPAPSTVTHVAIRELVTRAHKYRDAEDGK